MDRISGGAGEGEQKLAQDEAFQARQQVTDIYIAQEYWA